MRFRCCDLHQRKTFLDVQDQVSLAGLVRHVSNVVSISAASENKCRCPVWNMSLLSPLSSLHWTLPGNSSKFWRLRDFHLDWVKIIKFLRNCSESSSSSSLRPVGSCKKLLPTFTRLPPLLRWCSSRYTLPWNIPINLFRNLLFDCYSYLFDFAEEAHDTQRYCKPTRCTASPSLDKDWLLKGLQMALFFRISFCPTHFL